MNIKFEFPADRKEIALAIGKALIEIGQGDVTNAKAVNSLKGPFHWLQRDFKKHGVCETWDEMQSIINNEPLVEYVSQDEYDKWVNFWNEEFPADAVEQHVEVETDPNERSVVQSATVTTGSGEVAASAGGVSQTALAGGNVDEKGVSFNGEFCGKAAIPFYGSGKKKGQWKKRQGVDEDAYDEWYAEALLGDKVEEEPKDTAQTETTSDGNIAASMFAASDAQNAAASEDVPQDAGQLMKWVSEQQVAGNITQQQVTDAYTALQLPFDAVMNPAYPVANNCAAIYNHLKGQIG